MPNSSSVYAHRRANLARLLTEKGAKTHLAARLGCTQAAVSQWLRDPNERHSRIIHEGSARGIEQALNLPPLELDKPPLGFVEQPVLHVAMPTETAPAPLAENVNGQLKDLTAEFLELAEQAGTLDEAKRYITAARGLLQLRK